MAGAFSDLRFELRRHERNGTHRFLQGAQLRSLESTAKLGEVLLGSHQVELHPPTCAPLLHQPFTDGVTLAPQLGDELGVVANRSDERVGPS